MRRKPDESFAWRHIFERNQIFKFLCLYRNSESNQSRKPANRSESGNDQACFEHGEEILRGLGKTVEA